MADKRKFKVYNSNNDEIIICVPYISGDYIYPSGIQYMTGTVNDLCSEYPDIFDSEYTVLTTDRDKVEVLYQIGFNVLYLSSDDRLYFDSENYLYVDDGKIVSSTELLLGVQPFTTGMLPSMLDIPSHWVRKIEVNNVHEWSFTYETVFTTNETIQRYVNFVESAEGIITVNELPTESIIEESEPVVAEEPPVILNKSKSLRGVMRTLSITPGAPVKFEYGSKASYASTVKLSNTFYYITDTNELYLGSELVATGSSISYSTDVPSEDNTNGLLKVIVTDTEPVTRYDGYLYIITGTYL